MKNPIIPLLAALGLCSISCYRTPVESGLKTVVAELPVRSRQMGITTRATDDEALRDVNWWLCDADDAVILHGFQNDATVRFECIPNTYRLRIAANMGTDLGNAPAWDDLKVSHADDRDVLPMSCDVPLDIPASAGGVVRLPAVEVERRAAKISCNISVKAPGIELRSVRLCSVPSSVPLFASDAAPSDNPDDYTDTPVRPLSGRQAAAEFFLLPNEQGTVPEITDQRQKNPDNAPANASCLLIRAAEGDRMLTYTVYLGENNTSDFNVRANRHYRMNVSVLGDNAVDTRIFSYALHVWDDFDQSGFGGYCTYEGTTCLHVDVSDNDAALPLGGTITVTAGDASQVRIDDFRGGSGPDFEVPFPTSTNIFGVQYHPRVFTEKNARFAYHVTLRDPFGICGEYDFEHRMANEVHIMTGTGGNVAVEHALVTRSYGDGDSRQTAALCYEEGCRLTASANAGYTFVGWYADRGYTRLLSRETAYDFVPQENLETLFARFRARDIALDGAGTANCYIAMHLNSVYSFDATVMGNGRATKNIVPEKLSGVAAKVLWETGSVRGAVVRSADYLDGRVCFETGTAHGNAVIGLFDAAGDCIWSWHIWSVTYDPSIYAKTYSTGAVFMDRNLGAESTSTNDVRTKGLYYQWGRKDPFPYPATNRKTDNETPAATSCLEGYAFKACGRNTAPSLPAGSYTIQWAIGHPTVLLTSAPASAGSGQAYTSAWCSPLNPNLWGCGTDGSNSSEVHVKTIYDPCPPGWRVPQPGAWDKAYFNKSTYVEEGGWYMCYTASGRSTTWYPFSGYLDGHSGKMQYYWPASQVRVWTNTPTLTSSKDCARYLYISDESGVVGITDAGQDEGIAVRCIRE